MSSEKPYDQPPEEQGPGAGGNPPSKEKLDLDALFASLDPALFSRSSVPRPEPWHLPTSAGSPSSGEGAGVLVFVGALAFLFMAAKLPQVLGLILAGVLLLVSAVAARRGKKAGRVGVALALAGAVAVVLFIPPSWSEHSLTGAWQATRRQESELEALRPNNVNGFLAGRDERQAVAAQYPSLFQPRLRQAEQAWAERSLDAVTAELDRATVISREGLDQARQRKEQLVAAVRNRSREPRNLKGEESRPLSGEPPAALSRRFDEAVARWGARVADKIEEDLKDLKPDHRKTFLTTKARGEALLALVPAAERDKPSRRFEQAVESWGTRALKAAQDRLEKLRPLDEAGFRSGIAQRDFLRRQFPQGNKLLAAAEETWGRRSARTVAARLVELPPGDLAGFRKERAQRAFLKQTIAAARGEVETAEQAWGKRSVDQAVARLRAVSAADRDRFKEERRRTQELVKEFSALRPALAEAEKDWGKKAVGSYSDRLKGLPAGDLAGYRLLQAERKELCALIADLATPLRAAEWRWAGRTADAAIVRADGLLATNPLGSSAALRDVVDKLEGEGFSFKARARANATLDEEEAVQQRVLKAREKAVRASLESARRQARELIGKKRYQALAQAAGKLAEALGPEAQEVGRHAELLKFRQSCDFLANLARTAGKSDPP